MCVMRPILVVMLFLSGIEHSFGSEDVVHHSAHRIRNHRASRRHRAVNDGELHFEPEPYSKNLELNTSGKIHCKVAGGVAPTVQWFLNDEDPLPEGVTSANGTLMVADAERRHSGQYTCKAVDGDRSITAKINLDVVVAPRVVEPSPGQQMHVTVGQTVVLHCVATGDPPPTTHWDGRNLDKLGKQHGGLEAEDSVNASTARLVQLNNGTLIIRNVSSMDAEQYGCTAGNAGGLARHELQLIVHQEGELPPQESSGVAGKAVVVSVSVAGAYMVLVLALMVYCRRRRLRRRQRGEKMELEMTEGREKLVEDGEEEKQKVNGAALQNGRLLAHDKDSGADNSEVSGVSRASKKSGQFEHLSVPRSLLTEQITLGRGEFGEVMLAKIDMCQVNKLRNKESLDAEGEPKLRPVLVKALTTKDEVQLGEFRRQLELFSRVRHEHVVRLLGLCDRRQPHYLLLEHTDWGELKKFLIATRSPEENAEYISRVGAAHAPPPPSRAAPPLGAEHRALLGGQLAAALAKCAAHRFTHRDIAARNCVITSKLQLKLSYPALTRGPDSHEYYKLHEQVIPLRWLPPEAVLESDYSTKSDVYMFAATVWEIYTKGELPFAKLNDNSVLERVKAGTLEWTIPDSMPEPLAVLLKRCWSKSPSDRPQFTEIYDQITDILKDITSENTSQKSQDKAEE
ncbi:tyrosine-protein kinase-like otk isoform X2 [Spodoptera litura]|uniref:Tyrosine-protein kinase-like otk isoform X2 n=1 Tax=Spodoptera litura TaxID=69820 RepID=A0A9J7IVM3_SPOLT|nr:tyrosine-protein kinase-like otk isoform X2 [Spodoptera litura]